MDKYDGMHRVQTQVRENTEVVKKERGGKGFFHTLFWQAVVSLAVAGALIAAKFWGGAAATVTNRVKEAVSFDAFAYVQTLWEQYRA